MSLDYLNEAFKRLELLEEQMFDGTTDGINDLDNFFDKSEEEIDKIRVIDPEASTSDELKDSYVGKVIINCNVCHSHIFEDKDDIVIEDDIVNPEMSCPYCGEEEGFVIVGEIVPYSETQETDDIDAVETDEGTEETNESLLGTIGLGLAGGAALGVGQSLGKKLMGEDADKETLDEGLIGDINLGVDVSGNSVGFLGGTANKGDSSTTNNATEIQENKSLRASRATKRTMKEDFKEVSITTDDQHMEMTSDDAGKVTVTTEPIETADNTSEIISEISDETTNDILDNNDLGAELEEPVEEIDIDEVDEEGLDDLGESYLRRVYENVDSFKTTNVSANSSALIVEGVIKFKSGATKKTGFIFESKDINRSGKVRFSGKNKQLTETSDAFSLVGSIDNKKLFVESLKYNYKVDNDVVRGIIRRK